MFSQRQTLEEGLPNLGVTCFLNSCLQLLFSCNSFRSIVKQHSSSSETQNLCSCLNEIFECIEGKKCLVAKRGVIEKFIRKFESNQPQRNIDFWKQNDCLHILSEILDDLVEEVGDFMEDSYSTVKTVRCQSCQTTVKTGEFLLLSKSYCPKCESQITPVFETFPQFFLMLGEHTEDLTFANHSQESREYSVKGKIYYTGSGQSGHYVAMRRDHSQIFKIYNDSDVRNLDLFSLQHYKASLCLYEIKETPQRSEQQQHLIPDEQKKQEFIKLQITPQKSNDDQKQPQDQFAQSAQPIGKGEQLHQGGSGERQVQLNVNDQKRRKDSQQDRCALRRKSQKRREKTNNESQGCLGFIWSFIVHFCSDRQQLDVVHKGSKKNAILNRSVSVKRSKVTKQLQEPMFQNGQK